MESTTRKRIIHFSRNVPGNAANTGFIDDISFRLPYVTNYTYLTRFSIDCFVNEVVDGMIFPPLASASLVTATVGEQFIDVDIARDVVDATPPTAVTANVICNSYKDWVGFARFLNPGRLLNVTYGCAMPGFVATFTFDLFFEIKIEVIFSEKELAFPY